ncbi:MAG: hypothetical protein ACI8WY_003765, partial [Planctomycetota bacterium]
MHGIGAVRSIAMLAALSSRRTPAVLLALGFASAAAL